jgi:hypothetical protein
MSIYCCFCQHLFEVPLGPADLIASVVPVMKGLCNVINDLDTDKLSRNNKENILNLSLFNFFYTS